MNKKICIVYTHHKLGDLIWQLPYIKAISQHHGEKIDLVLREKTQAKNILKDLKYLNYIFYNNFRKGFGYWVDVIKLTKIFIKSNYDFVYILDKVNKPAIAAKLAGIKKVYCYPLFKKKELHLVEAAKKFTCKSLNLSDCQTETLIQISEKKIEKTKKLFDENKFNIVIGAGSSGPDTRWGKKNFIKLINQLNNKDNFYFYIQAGPDQKDISREIINNVNKKNCMDLSDLSVREILPFFSLCDGLKNS